MTEWALPHSLAPLALTGRSIDQLISATGLPNVRFGVLPAGRHPPNMLMHDYWIIANVVLIETITTGQKISDPGELTTDNDVIDMLWVSGRRSTSLYRQRRDIRPTHSELKQ